MRGSLSQPLTWSSHICCLSSFIIWEPSQLQITRILPVLIFMSYWSLLYSNTWQPTKLEQALKIESFEAHKRLCTWLNCVTWLLPRMQCLRSECQPIEYKWEMMSGWFLLFWMHNNSFVYNFNWFLNPLFCEEICNLYIFPIWIEREPGFAGPFKLPIFTSTAPGN